MKTCNVCRVAKPHNDFPVRRKSTDGLSYTCRHCANTRTQQFRQDHPTHHADWYLANREHKAKYWAKWYKQNKEARSKSYAQWEQANHGARIALNAKRNAAKYRATPAWADLAAIRAFYNEAARLTLETGIQHHVDHIYPLQGATVCGLHVAENLQVLTRTENIRKHNKLPTHAA